MIDWFPFMGFGTVFSWLVSIAIAYLVYKDAEKRNMNGLLWGLPILIPWVGILFLILYLIMRDGGHNTAEKSSTPARTTAEQVLDERYAKGELTREIYMQMKEDLGKSVTN
ncbi:MAG TPA: SHOCT domain-containing protein [Methanothrix sp.]|nr:SHOCT domain-containing protein [Methanothrix sp.]